ncbi:hypothetical protein CcaverHIS002_0301310 [Cutaneotrichosporon cavernicola]|uniref:SCP domain-containing protein n=1 Tax=Cutaneotrichosporon cavernicola TaxID=279322 RepID=A0AA48I6A0_9TREE|nr:uncharacterized protein CcaverHIS019_0301270 [Cutaneotrichosporon cavernicola]BEI82263.1 hypothetical protein CcaverHIS002_0301310 [Cutaneotrichosporon cavernicola]BEI90057.1 hypothetical protein CcaverHIS019_0301270 [Cutaneotrichosporon cavernicola]
MRAAAIIPILALLVTADARKCKAKTKTNTSAAAATSPIVTDNALIHQPPSSSAVSSASSAASVSTTSASEAATSESASAVSESASSASESASSVSESASAVSQSATPSPSESATPSSSESATPSPSASASPQGPGNPEGAVPVSDPIASSVLAAHNEIRRRYDVPEVAWNDELSGIAVQQAQSCNFDNQFPDKRKDYTDVIWNNAEGNFVVSIEQAGSQGENYQWPEEGKDKTYQDATNQWTQVVWKATTDVGCGWHKCEEWSGNPSLNGQYKFVCVYNTHQTYVGSPEAFNENIPNKPKE